MTVKGFDPHENRNLLWLLCAMLACLGVWVLGAAIAVLMVP